MPTELRVYWHCHQSLSHRGVVLAEESYAERQSDIDSMTNPRKRGV